jgi:hypothetical protein
VVQRRGEQSRAEETIAEESTSSTVHPTSDSYLVLKSSRLQRQFHALVLRAHQQLIDCQRTHVDDAAEVVGHVGLVCVCVCVGGWYGVVCDVRCAVYGVWCTWYELSRHKA